MKETVNTVAMAVAKKRTMSKSETSQVSLMLMDLTKRVASDSQLASDTKIADNTLRAVVNVLAGSSADSEGEEQMGPKLYQTIDEETFEALAQTVDMLISSTATQTDAMTKE